MIDAGPNAGSAMLAQQPGFEDPRGATAFVHPALYPPPAGEAWADPEYARWYNDQNGQPSGTCDQHHMPLLRQEAERHEGFTVAQNSHAGVTNRIFRSKKFHEQVERVYVFTVDPAELRTEAYRLWINFAQNEYFPAQRAFDTSDYAIIGTKMGCATDHNPNNP
jgi:hypothetical protein